MKIRNGFVSNSSTSSFCIYGISIENGSEDMNVLLKKYGLLTEEEDESGDNFYEKLDDLTERLEKEGLEVHQYPDAGTYIGRSWSGVKDNETGKEFKKDVETKLKEIFDGKLPEDIDTYAEAYHD